MIPIKTILVRDDIILRQIMPMDADDIFHTIDTQRTYLGEWLPFVANTLTVNDSIDFINTIVRAADEKELCVFTIRKNEQFAGILGFKGTDFANKKTEIGYWLSEDYQGQGIMTHSVKTLCNRAFKKLNINRIQIKCAARNKRSSAIPERLGFTFEGIEREGEMMSHGQFVDLKVYSLLKGDWEREQ